MSANRIKVLSKDLSSKIAAGEVVERPMAVIKELLENSIDSGADRIIVEIRKGGKELIKVSDNGSGIHKDDLGIAFTRHATSKISTVDDLYNINTLGFRGEALASISAVSRVEINTRHLSAEIGQSLKISGGDEVERKPVGMNTGTTILVKDLFFNTPARLKFLKSDRAEQSSITDLIYKIVLSHPEIAFKYVIDGKDTIQTPGNNKLINTIHSIYDKNLCKSLMEISSDVGKVNISGYISSINYSRGSRQLQNIFVNGRYVKDKVLEDTIKLAYNTMLPKGRFPAVFLFIEVDPRDIDVNIHPAKIEIKFSDIGGIKNIVYDTLKNKLLTSNQIPKNDFKSNPDIFKRELPLADEPTNLSLANKGTNKISHETVNIKRLQTDEMIKEDIIVNPLKIIKELEDEIQKDKESLYNSTSSKSNNIRIDNKNKHLDRNVCKEFDNNIKGSVLCESFETSLEDSQDIINQIDSKLDEISITREIRIKEDSSLYENNQDKIDITQFIYIGKLFNTYLLFQFNDSMYIMDQHAAHERILYEKFLEDYKSDSIIRQILLLPEIMSISGIDKEKILQNLEHIAKLGLVIEEFGEREIVIREIPQLFNIPGSIELVKEIIESLNSQIDSVYEIRIEDIIQKSCKNAIKAHDDISIEEIDQLVKDLNKTKNPFTCPHGRPIIISMNQREIEKKFKRIQ